MRPVLNSFDILSQMAGIVELHCAFLLHVEGHDGHTLRYGRFCSRRSFTHDSKHSLLATPICHCCNANTKNFFDRKKSRRFFFALLWRHWAILKDRFSVARNLEIWPPTQDMTKRCLKQQNLPGKFLWLVCQWFCPPIMATCFFRRSLMFPGRIAKILG